MRRAQLAVAGFEDGGKGPQAKDCGQRLETGKGKETYFPLEPLKECNPADTLILA